MSAGQDEEGVDQGVGFDEGAIQVDAKRLEAVVLDSGWDRACGNVYLELGTDDGDRRSDTGARESEVNHWSSPERDSAGRRARNGSSIREVEMRMERLKAIQDQSGWKGYGLWLKFVTRQSAGV